MDCEEYWRDIDSRLEHLLEYGFVKLPSLDIADLEFISREISGEIGLSTFKELAPSHRIFLDNLSVDRYLTPKLLRIAKDVFGFKGEITNQYHIARKVEPGNSTEMFRAHFDSHIFTMVFTFKEQARR